MNKQMTPQNAKIVNERGVNSEIQAEDFYFRIYELLLILKKTAKTKKSYKQLRNQMLVTYSTYCFFVEFYGWKKDDYIEHNKNEIMLYRLEEATEDLSKLSKHYLTF